MVYRKQLPSHVRLFTCAGLFMAGLAGCRHNQAQSSAVPNGDPAAANMAQPYTGGNAGGYGAGSTQVLAQSTAYTGQASSESYETQPAAPIIRRAPTGTAATQGTTYYPVPQGQTTPAQYTPGGQTYPNESQAYQTDPDSQPDNGAYDEAEQAGQDAITEADQAPPPLPEYDQPPAPADDYEWTPGYWNYATAGFYWVPGAWVAPPFYGALWTPPYWGYAGSRWHLHRGYWGPHIGYYGGINYGFGYIGTGYFGGYWNDRHFFYNRAVTNVNITNVHNVYNRAVVYNNVTYGPHSSDRVSYNGGRGGVTAQPRPQELAAMHETHFAPTAVQREHRQAAATDRGQFFAENHGRPAQAFAGRPVGSLSNVGAPPQSFLAARPGQPSGAPSANRPVAGFPAPSAIGNHADRRPDLSGNRPDGRGPDNALATPNRTGTPQPDNMHRLPSPEGIAGAGRFRGTTQPGGAPEPTRGNPDPRNTRTPSLAQPGPNQPANRLQDNAAHLPTPEAPRTQINGPGATGRFRAPQPFQPQRESYQPAMRLPQPSQPQTAPSHPEAQQQQRFGQQQRPQFQQEPSQLQQQRPQFQQQRPPEARPEQQQLPRPESPRIQRQQTAPRAEAPHPAEGHGHAGPQHQH